MLHILRYVDKLLSFKTRKDFDEFLEHSNYPKLTYPSLEGVEEEVIPGGASTYLSFDNHEDYVSALAKFRLAEMSCPAQVAQVRAGLSTLVPIASMAALLTSEDVEEAVCGGADQGTTLLLLRANTTYQAGLTERDEHILHFWSALESLTAAELRGFLKFACNQERLPAVSPGDESPPPPFPMKLAPADGRATATDPDALNIRAETCMFMVKLPVYSSFTITRRKILFAINAAYDPLSG